MKQILFFFVAIISFCCNKAKNVVDKTSDVYPQRWVLTIDANADRYIHIEVAGNSTKRSLVDKSYSLPALANERDCRFEISGSRNEANNQRCFQIQSLKDRRRWLFASISPNKQEVHLSSRLTDSEINSPLDDNFKFKIHRLEDVNGVKTVAIESLALPGYYISSSQPGFNYSPTQVVLTKERDPNSATAWQCRSW